MAQIVKEWLQEGMKNRFHTWIGTSESRPYIHLKSGMCWWRLYTVLDSCIYQKFVLILTKNVCTSRCLFTFCEGTWL